MSVDNRIESSRMRGRGYVRDSTAKGPRSVPKALLCWVTLIALLLVVLLPAARRVSWYRELARRGNCKARLRVIGLGVIMYANDFSGHLPPNLGLLPPKYVNETLFICPSTKEYGGVCSELPWFCERRLPPDDGSYRYEYLGVPLDKVVTPPETTILMYDKPGNHRDGANVLFLDGHLEWREGFLRPDWTPLHMAAEQGRKDVVERLIGDGAEVNACDTAGKTPLDLAQGKGHKDIADLLRRHGGRSGKELK